MQDENMPAPLRTICEAVSHQRVGASNREALQATWRAYLDQAEAQIPGLHIASDGEIVYWGDLSPGCQACKSGSWDCIFTTMTCNLDCEFCYSPLAIPRDYAGSVFGTSPEQIAENHARTCVTGISFSGGEPFLEPQRLFEWVAWFKSHFPERYTWVYTNGLLAEGASLQRLGQLGLDEIRFNAAATGYTHPVVMEHIASAALTIPNVTIEIPAIPEHASRLLGSLEDWSACGVKYLNLHELIYEPGSNSARMAGLRQSVILEDGHHAEIHPRSRPLTLAVMQKVREKNLPLSVNDCSLQSKLRQLRGRRRLLAPLTKEPHEKMVEDQTLESYCLYRGQQEYRFCHPDSVAELRAQYPDYQWVKVVRSAPLALQGPRQWIAVEKC